MDPGPPPWRERPSPPGPVPGTPPLVQVLGTVAVTGHPVGASLERRLLALLVLRRPQPFGQEALIDALWDGRPPPAAANSLMSKVSRLRKVLGRDRLVRTPSGFVLRLAAGELDTDRFEAGAARALDPTNPDALDDARHALALWRGQPYAEFAHDHEAMAEVARLERLHESVAVRHAELLLGGGHVSEALVAAEYLLQALPFNERLCEVLARALARLGRTAEALKAIHDFRGELVDAHGLSIGAGLTGLEHELLLATGEVEPWSAATRPAPPTLPQAPASRPIVGREAAVEAVSAALGPGRLVTVTGEAGIGKTAVALAVAARYASEHTRRPLVWVRAADPAAVVTMLCPEAGPGVLTQLGRDGAVLVLDGADHERETMTDLAGRAVDASVGVLVTTRAALGVPGEIVVRLDALPTDGRPSTAGSLLRTLTGLSSDDDLDEIAARLDGHPLAIELVARRLASVPAGVVLAELDDTRRREGLVTDWAAPLAGELTRSVERLSEPARTMFSALGYFPGGVSFELASSVAGRLGLDRVLPPLLELVDTGLVRVERSSVSERRYRQLAPIADVARALAAATASAERLADTFCDTMVAFAESTRSWDRGPDEGARAAQVAEELPNLRAAFDRLFSGGRCDAAVQLVAALQDEAVLRERTEVEEWAGRLVATEGCLASPWTPAVYGIVANAAMVRGDFARADAMARLGSDALAGGGEPTWVVPNVRFLLGASFEMGTGTPGLPKTWRHLRELERYTDVTGDPMGVALARFVEAFVLAGGGFLDRAVGPALAGLRWGRGHGSPSLSSMGHFTLALVRAPRNPGRALAHARAAAELSRTSACRLVERHATRLQVTLAGEGADTSLEHLVARSLERVIECGRRGHREQALQELAGLIDPLIRLQRHDDAALLCGGLDRTVWGASATVVGARQRLLAVMGRDAFDRSARLGRRRDWDQLADFV